MTAELILGEFRRTLDERFRLTVPTELMATFDGESCRLTKERAGCLGLWPVAAWRRYWEPGIQLLQAKLQAGRLAGRLDDVQLLGRLLSTRFIDVSFAGRSRLQIPEGFREFLSVEAGADVMVVGAGICLEIWHPDHWLETLQQQMPSFHRILNELSQ